MFSAAADGSLRCWDEWQLRRTDAATGSAAGPPRAQCSPRGQRGAAAGGPAPLSTQRSKALVKPGGGCCGLAFVENADTADDEGIVLVLMADCSVVGIHAGLLGSRGSLHPLLPASNDGAKLKAVAACLAAPSGDKAVHRVGTVLCAVGSELVAFSLPPRAPRGYGALRVPPRPGG